MKPDFSKATVDLLAKRSAYKCSNPDCRVSTVGPNENFLKATVIGEAAHIYGARLGSKRYLQSMNDVSRSEITNAIWLCRNCHKLIDTDESRFPANLLFSWRSEHDRYLLNELGNKSDKLFFEEESAKLKPFEKYPPIIRRIVIDEPLGWEWRIAAELIRYLVNPHFRKLKDLQSGMYVRPLRQLKIDEVPSWIALKIAEFQNLLPPFEGLLRNLTASFGELGEKGDLDEIHYVCKLIEDYLRQVILLEESIYFVHVPDECRKAVSLLKNVIGSQALKISEIPAQLDCVVDLTSSQEFNDSTPKKTISKVITLELPENWSEDVALELKIINGLI